MNEQHSYEYNDLSEARNRARCAAKMGTPLSWSPCPFHEPVLYAEYAARHKLGLVVVR